MVIKMNEFLKKWNSAFDAAHSFFSKTVCEYWAVELSYDYAEYICWGKEKQSGDMIFGGSYPYQAHSR